jgi:predicted CXXCH cytochrome family protein
MKPSIPWLAVAVVALLAAGGVVVWRWHAPADRREELPPGFDLPPLSASPFLNASPSARYTGIQSCVECHPREHRSYRQTAHSRALGDLDPRAEPPDGSFPHAASGQTCTIYRAEGKLRHRCAAGDSHGQEYVAEDHPIRFLIGSGRHTRSYLAEIDGFLCESPLTWYVSRQAWGMSPGYDRPNHRGFERAADATCLFCHAGRTADPDRDYQRLTILEQPIGCERCHGPGSLHVDQERSIRDGTLPAAQRQATIVHPAHLTRSRGEALCAQCHLNADSAVTNRGRSLNDFRPGLPLSDFCVNYRLEGPDAQMKVVGHVDQLHLSRCWRESETLTCTTCHDPHAAAAPAPEQYRKVCLGCHADAACKLPRPERLRQNAANDCLACHMPRVGTDIPHVAFTHHRIGVHSGRSFPRKPAGPTQPFPDLVAVDDVAHLSPSDQERNLGLAYFALSQRQTDPDAAVAYRDRGDRILRAVRSRGLPDGDVAAALARLRREDAPEAALQLAREALASETLSLKFRVNTLYLASEVSLQTNRIESAREALGQLTALRRQAQDWLLLALCCQGQGDLKGARRNLQQAVAIAPFRADLHDRLAALHELCGDTAAAQRERSTARRLIVQAGANR